MLSELSSEPRELSWQSNLGKHTAKYVASRCVPHSAVWHTSQPLPKFIAVSNTLLPLKSNSLKGDFEANFTPPVKFRGGISEMSASKRRSVKNSLGGCLRLP